MAQNKQAPYKHPDGSNCWTKECRRGNSFQQLPSKNEPTAAPTKKMMYAGKSAALVPRHLDEQHSAYYAATDKKHFGSRDQPGSKFLDPSLKKVEDVLMLRMEQTGTFSMNSDNRNELIARGSDPNGFNPNNRYLMVHTEGTVGIMNSSKLSGDAKVQVVRTKPGAPCSLVAEVDEQERTDFAVLVVGKHKGTGQDFLITTFPGPVTKPTSNVELDAKEGRTVTVDEVKKILGRDFWINTKIKP